MDRRCGPLKSRPLDVVVRRVQWRPLLSPPSPLFRRRPRLLSYFRDSVFQASVARLSRRSHNWSATDRP